MRWSHFLKQFSIDFLTSAAGKLTIDICFPKGFIKNDLHDCNTIDVFMLAVHLLPLKDHRVWGFGTEWHDGPLYNFGFGPFALFCWMSAPVLEKE